MSTGTSLPHSLRDSKEEKILTVSQITVYIKSKLENDDTLRNVWVEGEISNFFHATSGHMYFSVKDDSSVIRCVMFRSKNASLEFEPENGIKVNVLGSIEIYEPRGEYSIVIEQMLPAGRGPLFLKFQKLKKKLEKEGLFEEKYKKPIPFLPKKIGLAASESGKAVKDVIKTIKRRFPGVTIIFSNTTVQGDEAAGSIVKSLRILNTYPGIDVIILTRGGGSFEDLWPFNEEIVARAIFASKIPVISAIGHEPDVCISDYVADKRAATPTAAGQMVVPDKEELLRGLESLRYTAFTLIKRRTRDKGTKLAALISSRVFSKPYDRVNSYSRLLDERARMMNVIFTHKVKNLRNMVRGFESRLVTLNPSSVLERGYSIVMKGDEVLRDSKQADISDIVDITLCRGGLSCKVEKIRRGGG